MSRTPRLHAETHDYRHDSLLQDPVGGKPTGVFDHLAVEILIDFRIGEAGGGGDIDGRELAATPGHGRLENGLRALGPQRFRVRNVSK